jgi:ADP-heptose:LPS heptosyltransferase
VRRALIVSGGGIGNVIQSTAAVSAFQEIFKGLIELDVLLPRHHTYVPLIQGRIQVLTKPEISRSYTYVIPSWLLYRYALKMKTVRRGDSKVVAGQNPLKLGLSESASHVRAVFEAAAMQGLRPQSFHPFRTWCNFTVPAGFDNLEGRSRPLICLHDGGNHLRFWKAKRYTNWQGVYDLMVEKIPTAAFWVLGTKRDGSIRGDNVKDMRGRFSLLETAGILHEADLFLGNDTGLCHIAAALDTPSFVVFGPTNITKNLPPRNAFPIHETGGLACRPCQRLGGVWRRGVNDKRCRIECLAELPAEDVAHHIITKWEHVTYSR